MRAPLALLLAVGLLAGCAAGPDFKKPPAPAIERYQRGDAPAGGITPALRPGAEVATKWWTGFGSPALNELVDQALQANPTLDAARASLRAAQEAAAAQRGAYWPQVSASLASTRQKIADTLSSPLNNPSNPYSLHTAQVSVSFVPDVFGGNRRLAESLQAQADAQRFELLAARLTLADSVVVAAVQEASLRAQIAASEETIRLNTETLTLVRRQQELGAASRAAVAAQEAALAQSEAALPALRKQLAQNRDLLIALSGRLPDQDLAAHFELADLHLPAEIPLSLPSRLVERRPDVAAAEALAHAAAAQIGVAVANRLPQFGLTAVRGSTATSFGDLLKSGSGFWEIAGSIAQPLFDGGALAHRQAAAEAAYDQALAQYRATVIAAFQNVADALYALQQDGEAVRSSGAAAEATHRSYELARRQVELGDISHLALLNAAQADQQARIASIQAQAARLADVAALFQALGGGMLTD
jgi:NodT family efflux transporter outer membrane factor (OMF) lipoprotein